MPDRNRTHFWLAAALVTAFAGCEAKPAGKIAPTPEKQASLPAGPLEAEDSLLSTSGPDEPGATSPVSVTEIRLRDCAAERGLDFRYVNGPLPLKMMVQSTGGGAGWVDYDRDGTLDLYLPQGGDPTLSVPDPAGDRLFRGSGGRFRDVSSCLSAKDVGYGQGIAVGDFNNDGFPDVFVTNVGPDVLLQNQGDGTFEDVTAQAAVGDPRWGASAAWADLDEDGDLDLYVCNYLLYDVHNPTLCFTTEGKKGICHPEQLPPDDDECFENLGDGTFRPVAEQWGLRGPGGKSLGVVIADLAGDRRLDVFVANDTCANHLFVGAAGPRFDERAVELGCALTGAGRTQANMGVAFGDYNRDGLPDLYVTHFTEESNTLYANLGEVGFRDVTIEEGLHRPTLDELGFGTVMTDFDADGRDELFVANGHIDDWSYRGEAWYMASQLFQYDGRRRWIEISERSGPYFEKRYLGRAVATGDFDDDGRLDLAVVNQNDPLVLLRNESQQGHRLQIDLQGTNGPRDAVGARVEVRCGETVLVQHLAGGTSYCAAHQPRLFFGLGQQTGNCRISVTWPGTAEADVYESEADRRLVLREGLDGPASSTLIMTSAEQGSPVPN